MAKQYTIPQLLQAAGLRGYTPRLANALNALVAPNNEIEYKTALEQATVEILGYDITNVYDRSEVDVFSDKTHFEGLPIYMPLVVEQFDGIDEDYMFESAVLEYNRQKNIVVTTVQGRDSSIKEFINNGDYSISVSGVIASRGVGYPFEELAKIKAIFNAKQSLKVVHPVLNELEVYELVITDFSLPQSPFTNLQPYRFNAISEVPIELRIEEENS